MTLPNSHAWGRQTKPMEQSKSTRPLNTAQEQFAASNKPEWSNPQPTNPKQGFGGTNSGPGDVTPKATGGQSSYTGPAAQQYLDVKLQSITEVLQSSTQTEKDKQQDDDKLAAQVSPNRFSEALRAKAAELAIPFDEGDSRTWTTRSSHRNENWGLRRSGFFSVGRVFKVEWYEPLGQDISSIQTKQPRMSSGEGQASQATDESTDPSVNGCHKTYRRFLVIHKLTSSSLCVPIYTYESRGCLKHNLKEAEIRMHAVIHDGRKQSWTAKKEPSHIMLPPVPVQLVSGQALNQWSRVHFAGIKEVPHNLNVLHVGMVHPDHHVRIVSNVANIFSPNAETQNLV